MGNLGKIKRIKDQNKKQKWKKILLLKFNNLDRINAKKSTSKKHCKNKKQVRGCSTTQKQIRIKNTRTEKADDEATQK